MTPLSMDDILVAAHRLPSLPTVVTELIEVLNRDDANVDELASGIASDQSLAARALRVANSPFYGMTHKVSSIHDAIVVLGLRAVGSLVTAASIIGALETGTEGQATSLHPFWRHSIAVALCSRAVARNAGMDAETAFTAGLLHDIGKLLLAIGFPQHYRRVLEHAAAQDVFSLDAERELLGIDHGQVGAALAERWKFAPEIRQAVALHHAPADLAQRSLADVAHLGDVMAHALDLDGDPAAMAHPLDAVAWQRLGMDWDEFRKALATAEGEYEGYTALLSG